MNKIKNQLSTEYRTERRSGEHAYEDTMADKYLEKERMFLLLELFFMSTEETSEVTELSNLFELARTSGSNESYVILLEKLHSTSVAIPDIIVESLPTTTHGHALVVKALNADKYFGILLKSVEC